MTSFIASIKERLDITRRIRVAKKALLEKASSHSVTKAQKKCIRKMAKQICLIKRDHLFWPVGSHRICICVPVDWVFDHHVDKALSELGWKFENMDHVYFASVWI